jgi:hypothetical protein
MKSFLRLALASIVLTVVWPAVPRSAEVAPQPLYNNAIPVAKKDPLNFMPSFNGEPINPVTDIYMVNVPPATSVDVANRTFSDRAAAAILYAASLPLPFIGLNHEQEFGLKILAKMAYDDYFLGDDQVPGRAIDLRHEVDLALVNRFLNVSSWTCRETAGRVGSSANLDKPVQLHVKGEYDQLLTAYIKLYYKYYSVLSPEARHCIYATLLSIRGVYDNAERFFINGDALTIPETENHRLMIQAAKYLTNQLYYQDSVAKGHPDHANFDNNRNGNPPMVVVILGFLQSYLTHDFIEYNGRPYQDFTMTALMNLADYAYESRVRLAAQMVLDYISAKVAVSSHDLRRSTPFRRRNEDQHFGPTMPNGFLGSPLVYNVCCAPGTDPPQPYEPDPQGAFYTMMAGNTGVLQLNHTSPPNGHAPPNFAFEMVYAGLSDYRVPPSILDLFVGSDPGRRQFFQRFNHYSAEAYAGSPSYLISAGGIPTTYAYRGQVLGTTLDGLADSVDLGVALPTTFLPDIDAPGPPDPAITLTDVIQFGKKSTGTDQGTMHMCVARDFACGGPIYLPTAFEPSSHPNDPTLIADGENWTFVNRGSDGSKAGYYLAIYRVRNSLGEDWGFLEAYDTWLNGGSSRRPFEEFRRLVKAANPAVRLDFGTGQVNKYTTQSGQLIQFGLIPHSLVVDDVDPFNPPFAHGTIVKSEAKFDLFDPQGTGLIKISNPALGTQITLDMLTKGALHPQRTSEFGELLTSNGNEDIWVDFNYIGNGPKRAGDFGDPFQSLAEAMDAVAVGGTISIVPGLKNEPIVLKGKRVTIKSFPGSATIFGRQ